MHTANGAGCVTNCKGIAEKLAQGAGQHPEKVVIDAVEDEIYRRACSVLANGLPGGEEEAE